MLKLKIIPKEIIQPNSNFNLFSIILFLIFKSLSIMNRIKEVLEEKGIKQTWLAEKLKKSYNMVNSYVQNRRQPSIEDLNRIAEILDVDVRNLLVGNKD